MIKFTARGHKSWRLSSAVLTFVKCAQPPIVYCCPTILGPIWPAQHSLHGDENKIEQTVLKQSFKPCRRLVFFLVNFFRDAGAHSIQQVDFLSIGWSLDWSSLDEFLVISQWVLKEEDETNSPVSWSDG